MQKDKMKNTFSRKESTSDQQYSAALWATKTYD